MRDRVAHIGAVLAGTHIRLWLAGVAGTAETLAGIVPRE
jgi:hypothetical protein